MQDHTYVVNVDGVIVRDGEYLLIERGADEEHAGGLLAFPGGTVEQPPGGNDTIEKTIRREISEEVGVEVGAVEYVHSSTFEADNGSLCLNIVTLCEYVRGEAHSRAGDEVAETHWFSYDELKTHDDLPAFTADFADRVEEFRTPA
ncbi:MAG: NUDIX domain-containing protein [Euryarchaeota archaeon]|nr:NUDIX domain-containing protein [Euryarchaeota archaeon]